MAMYVVKIEKGLDNLKTAFDEAGIPIIDHTGELRNNPNTHQIQVYSTKQEVEEIIHKHGGVVLKDNNLTF